VEANTWWLLGIPLFFGLGWIAARLDAAQLFTQTRQLPESYFKGLNFLLGEQHEQAIASFEEVARLDPETAELYFALGSLFRKRGETERAIRIHRNLLERADLPETQRQQALFCLAQDYLNAGIFDRAESAFSSLASSTYAAQAQRELAKLYEKESNWQAAIACLQQYLATPKLTELERSAAQDDLSHYACELASSHIQSKDYDAAQSALTLAQASAPNNPRTVVCSAHLLMLQGQAAPAIALLNPLVATQPKLTALAIQTLLPQKDDAATLAALKRWALAHPSADAIKPLLPVLQAQGDTAGMQALLTALTTQLKHEPPRLAAAGLLLSQSANAAFASQANEWQTQAQAVMDSLTSRYDRPTCTHCGFKASRHQWRCPGCGRWNTLPYSAG
jgi:lipopolysaccharide biosynthesis regulator YciM